MLKQQHLSLLLVLVSKTLKILKCLLQSPRDSQSFPHQFSKSTSFQKIGIQPKQVNTLTTFLRDRKAKIISIWWSIGQLKWSLFTLENFCWNSLAEWTTPYPVVPLNMSIHIIHNRSYIVIYMISLLYSRKFLKAQKGTGTLNTHVTTPQIKQASPFFVICSVFI